MMNGGINDLAEDTWIEIFSYLSSQEMILNVPVVCKAWYIRCTTHMHQELTLKRNVDSEIGIIGTRAVASDNGVSDALYVC
jgi:hypothetical protein